MQVSILTPVEAMSSLSDALLDTRTASVPILVPSKAPQSTAAAPAESSSKSSKEQHSEHNRTY